MNHKRIFGTIQDLLTSDGKAYRKWIDTDGDLHVEQWGDGLTLADVRGDWQPTDEVWEVTPPKQWFDSAKVRANLLRERAELASKDPEGVYFGIERVIDNSKNAWVTAQNSTTIQDRINEIVRILALLNEE